MFEIGPDDYLLEIAGRSSDVLDFLVLKTYRGKYIEAGGAGGAPFSFRFVNQTFGAFSGMTSDYINFLEIPIIPIPKEFEKEIQSLDFNIKINGETKAMIHKAGVLEQVESKSTPSVQVKVLDTEKFGGFGKVEMPQIIVPTAIPMYGQPNNVAPVANLSASKYPDLNLNNPPSTGTRAYAPIQNTYSPVGYPNQNVPFASPYGQPYGQPVGLPFGQPYNAQFNQQYGQPQGYPNNQQPNLYGQWNPQKKQ